MMILFTLLACGGATDAASLAPAAVAAIADEIAADPTHVDDVLSNHGLDRAGFEARLFAIAADAAESKAYLDARR